MDGRRRWKDANMKHIELAEKDKTKEKNTLSSSKPHHRLSRRRTVSRYADESKDVGYSRLISNFRLSDWTRNFCVKTQLLSKQDKESFIDQQGVQRYTDSWQVVKDSSTTDESWDQYFFHTGCTKLSHLLEVYHSLKNEDNTSEEHASPTIPEDPLARSLLNQYAYLSEWQRLWIYFESDKKDEFAEYAPLFRILIEFLFHPIVQRMLVVLVVYNVVVTVCLLCIFPKALDYLEIMDFCFQIFFEPVTYFAMVVAYRGTTAIFSVVARDTSRLPAQPPTSPPPPPQQKAAEEEEDPSSSSSSWQFADRLNISSLEQTPSLLHHFTAVRQELARRIQRECSLLLHFSCASSRPLVCCCGLYRESQQSSRWRLLQARRSAEIRAQRGRRKLSYHEILNISLKFLIRANGVAPNRILFDHWTYRLGLLFIALVFPAYLLAAQYLTNLVVVLGQTCAHQRQTDTCQYFLFLTILTGGTLTKYLVQLVYGMSVLVGLLSLAYGAEIAFRLSHSFLSKTKSLRRVEDLDIEDMLLGHLPPPGPQETITSSGEQAAILSALHTPSPSSAADRSKDVDPRSQLPVSLSLPLGLPGPGASAEELAGHPLLSWVRRDAIEHYFFICEVLRSSDQIWSPALSLVFLVGTFNTCVYVIFLLTQREDISYRTFISLLVFVVVRVLIFFVYPVASICHANAYNGELLNAFARSSRQDFALIGGCREWVDFMAACPAAWTFHGLWITWERLFGLLWTFLAAGLASAIASIAAFA
jgi:hypothetical protein